MIEQRTAYDRRKSHGRKTSYSTLDGAEDAARKVNEGLVLTFSPIVAYPCRYCPAFHVGHRDPVRR